MYVTVELSSCEKWFVDPPEEVVVCSAVVVPVCDIGDIQPNEAGLHVEDVEAGKMQTERRWNFSRWWTCRNLPTFVNIKRAIHSKQSNFAAKTTNSYSPKCWSISITLRAFKTDLEIEDCPLAVKKNSMN